MFPILELSKEFPMKKISSILILSILGVLAALGAKPSHACSPMMNEDRYFQYEAPENAAFFVHLIPSDDRSLEEAASELILMDTEENVYPAEVVSRAGAALAIRVPELPVGTELQVLGSELSLSNWDYAAALLKVTEATDDETEVALPKDADVTTVVTEVESDVIPLTPLALIDSCGGVEGPALRVRDRVTYAEVHFPKEIFESGPLVLDMWTTKVGEEVDVEADSSVAGLLLGRAGQVPEYGHDFSQETEETVFFTLSAYFTDENPDVHFRFRNPRTGVPGDIFTKTIHLPERQENVSYGCQALPQVPMSFMGLFSLLLGMVVYRRQGQLT
jgi:hypothetical protein